MVRVEGRRPEPGDPQAQFGCWVPAYIGLGSNLGDSRALIKAAIDALAELDRTQVIAESAHYRSRPLGPVAQGDFINAAVGLLTQLSAEHCLQELQRIERALGRRPQRLRWGPREIDLDLLIHGDRACQTETLRLPHPGIPEREFVLYPLQEIAADLRVGEWGTVRELAARVPPRGIERLASDSAALDG